MTNITPEMIAQARAAKSVAELLAIAEANEVELTAEEAKTYFEQFHSTAAVSDDELQVVAGGSICHNDEKSNADEDSTGENSLEDINGNIGQKLG